MPVRLQGPGEHARPGGGGHRAPQGDLFRTESRIRGLAPHMAITKVKAHVNKHTLTDPEEIFRAEGNDAADRVAKSAAEDLLSKPSPAEVEDWARQTRLLKAYLQHVPRALEKWPAVAPSSGRTSLKRCAPAQDGALRRHTFQADVLGEWAARPAGAETATQPSSTSQAESFDEVGARPAAEAIKGARPATGAPPPTAQERPRVSHQWRSRSGTWYCRVSLSVSRAPHPPNTRCPGLAPNLAKVVSDPRGHNILVAPRTDGTGIVLICSRCGHYAASARPSNLQKKDCLDTFESPGAEQSFERFSQGIHPRYAEGPAKVLEKAFPATWLVPRGPTEDAETTT